MELSQRLSSIKPGLAGIEMVSKLLCIRAAGLAVHLEGRMSVEELCHELECHFEESWLEVDDICPSIWIHSEC